METKVERTASSVILLVGLASIACTSNAQPIQNVSVQLPTFHVTGVSTTVLVPDSGSLYLGGVGRSRFGGSSFGPGVPGLGNRGFGRAVDAGGFSMGATIIDHREIDRALLAEAARRRGDKVDIYGRPVADAPRLARGVSSRRSGVRARDGRNPLAPVRHRSSAYNSTATDEAKAKTYLERAQRAEARGQPQQAKIFYQRVVKHGGPRLKQQAETRIQRLGNSKG